MNLDPRTVVILTILSTFLMGISLFFVARGYLSQMRGVTRWATGTLLQTSGWIFLALLGVIPSYIAEIGSPLIMLGLALYYHALVAFKAAELRVLWVYATVAVNVVLIYVFLLAHPDMSARIVIASATGAILMFASARLLLAGNMLKLPISHSLTGALFAICSVVLSVRAVYYLFWNTAPDQSAFEQNWVQDIAFLTFFLAGVVSSFTFILMCNDRYNDQSKLRTEELAQKNAELELANQAKGQFLATMSHEIRTPLNGVVGFLSQLGKTRLDSQQRDFLNTVNLSAKMLLSVINDVLDYSKIEAGKLSIENVEIGLREFLDETISMFAANAEEKGLALVCIVDHKLPRKIFADPLRLTQIISNLLSNAIKFTEQGEIVLEARLREESAGGMVMQLSVTDTGIGIAQDDLARLFQPFVQADVSTTRKYGGSGLGLIIARRLVDMMGGRLEVESEVGRGTRFIINLSLNRPVVQNYPDIAAIEQPSLKMLMISSSTLYIRSINEFLLAGGGCLHAVSSVVKGLELLIAANENGEPFNVVIYDEQSEKIQPADFAKILRASAEGRNINLLLLAGLSSCQEADQWRLEGYSNCLSKPVKFGELYVLLSNACPAQVEYMTAQDDTSHAAAQLQPLSGKEVLIVDDHAINRKLAHLLIENLGGSPDLAESGMQAIEACKNKKYDLILMDINMPEMDGMEATGRIRRLESSHYRTPIFALTANALPGDKERFIAAGMDDYLSKPVSEQALLSLLQKWQLTRSEGMVVSDTAVADKEDSLPALDPQLGIRLSFDDADTWNMVLGMMLNELGDYAGKLSALSESDKDPLIYLAHKLAGTSSYCGTPALHQAARQLEFSCMEEDMSQISRNMNQLKAQIERMRKLDADGKLRGSRDIIY